MKTYSDAKIGEGRFLTELRPQGSELSARKDKEKRSDRDHGDLEADAGTTISYNSMGVEQSTIEWRDITKQGEILGPQQFRARGLTPGSRYIFRVRQRNSIGWSGCSEPSDVIETLITAPPSAPVCVRVTLYYVSLQWSYTDRDFQFSTLENDVQIARIPVTSLTEDVGKLIHLVWVKASIRRDKHFYAAAVSSGEAAEDEREESHRSVPENDHYNCNHVLVEGLSPMTSYVARVRVRTVAGWTTWSNCSDIFRTLSPP